MILRLCCLMIVMRTPPPSLQAAEAPGWLSMLKELGPPTGADGGSNISSSQLSKLLKVWHLLLQPLAVTITEKTAGFTSS
jgi:hypothetical protein